MDRRKFVQAAAAAGSLGWLTSVDRIFAQSAPTAFTRPVPFVGDPAGAGLTPDDVASLFAVDAEQTAAQQALVYPQSVASGDPRANGIVLWTRIDPSQQGGAYADMVGWQIATNSTFTVSSLLAEGVATVYSSADNTVKFPVASNALQPYTNYYYRFIYNRVASRTGQFKTLPAPDASLVSLKIGYVVCQDYGNGFYTALAYLAQEDVDFIIHLGDYIYETITATAFAYNPARTMPPFPSGSTTIPVNLDDYRHLYKVYKSDLNQQAVHERFAYIQLWDDHEFANDCHQDFHPDDNTAPNTATTPQPALRQAANQAWSEYGLANVPFDPTQGWEQSIQVYRKFSLGTLADVIVTDERLYRDGPPCGNNDIGQRYFSIGCPEILDSSRSMLGVVQKQWFIDQVTGSTATWKIWVNEVMLMQLKATAVYVDLDQWDGYGEERKALLNIFKDAKVKNLVAITGDLHTFLAGYLKPDFDDIFASGMGIELMVGSISSANFEEEILSGVHLPSSAVPAKMFGVAPNLLDPLIRFLNPHIKYWDSSTHGYAVLTLTPEQLTCEFKAVTTVREPTANLVALKTFTVPAGKVKLES
jgi:alkaline phosphatase D